MTAQRRYLSSHLAARLLHNWTLPHTPVCLDGTSPLPGAGGGGGHKHSSRRCSSWRAQANLAGGWWGVCVPTLLLTESPREGGRPPPAPAAGETRGEGAPWRLGGGGAAGVSPAGRVSGVPSHPPRRFVRLIAPSRRLARGEGEDGRSERFPPSPVMGTDFPGVSPGSIAPQLWEPASSPTCFGSSSAANTC